MKSLTTFLSKLTRTFRYGERINPVRDWFVLLAIAGVLLCASLGWNIWLFSRVTAGEAIGTATTTPAAADLNLDSIQTLFNARSAERARYVNTYHFVDPSL